MIKCVYIYSWTLFRGKQVYNIVISTIGGRWLRQEKTGRWEGVAEEEEDEGEKEGGDEKEKKKISTATGRAILD